MNLNEKKNIILLFFCRSCEQGCHLLALFLWHALLIILFVILGRWNMFKSCQTPSYVSEENRKSLLQLLGQQSADLWYRLHFSNTMYKTRAFSGFFEHYCSFLFIFLKKSCFYWNQQYRTLLKTLHIRQ